jgi:hypothetical protein
MDDKTGGALGRPRACGDDEINDRIRTWGPQRRSGRPPRTGAVLTLRRGAGSIAVGRAPIMTSRNLRQQPVGFRRPPVAEADGGRAWAQVGTGRIWAPASARWYRTARAGMGRAYDGGISVWDGLPGNRYSADFCLCACPGGFARARTIADLRWSVRTSCQLYDS